MFDPREHAPTILYLCRKAVEDLCSCGKQSSNVLDHTESCFFKREVMKTAIHAQERVSAKEIAKRDEAKQIEQAEAKKAANEKAAQQAADAVGTFFPPATADAPPAGKPS